MVAEKIDLTLESIFSGQENPSLLFDSARRYQEENNSAKDIRRRLLDYGNIFDFSIEHIIHNARQLGLYDKSLFKTKEDGEFQNEVNQLFYKLFGRYQKWYSEMSIHEIYDWNLFVTTSASGSGRDEYSESYGKYCDCCGKRINLINSRYSICFKCDDFEEKEAEKKLRALIKS